MPRIQCPGNKDCYIDCPGSGYAFYVEPYGPCEKGCDQENTGNVLRQIIINAETGAKYTGMVVGITTGVLAAFARYPEITQRAPSTSSDDIADLQRLDILTDDRRINVKWKNTDLGGVLRALAEAATGTEESGQASAA